jgi:hypothetical protein
LNGTNTNKNEHKEIYTEFSESQEHKETKRMCENQPKEKADWVKGRTMILNTKLDTRMDGILSSN